MSHRNIFAIALTGLTITAGAGVLYAQAIHPGAGATPTTHHCPMMQAHAEGPAAALEHRDQLGLSAEQLARLESLREAADRVHRDSGAAMREIHQQLEAVMTSDRFDEAAARRALRRMGDLHTEIGLAVLRARHATAEVLTPEQRRTLTDVIANRGGMMGDTGMMGGMHGMQGMGGMMGMMGSCPMMEDAMHHGEGSRAEGAGGRS